MQKIRFIIYGIGLLLLLIAACNSQPPKMEETPTSGNISICVDDSYRLIIDAEVYTFQSLYPNAKIRPVYKPEADAFADFLNDSVNEIIAGRELTSKENEYLAGKKLVPRTTRWALDAVAFIINNDNPDSLITYQEIKDIFNGSLTSWKQMHSGKGNGNIKMVFDNNKSSNTRYIKNKFHISTFPSSCYAVNTSEEVVNFVQKDRNSIGIINVNWISDPQDTVSHSFLKKIKVAAISSESDPGGVDGYYTPCQGFISNKEYPFIKDVFVICKETFTGLGTGFSSFIAGDIGQRIVLKSGLLPATMPVRVVKIKNKFE
ncbi:MAG: substrate-binding domain-containing protein [Bacteroidia bacterium]|nr:substrate-binding domain-containing protein [Bacteroidia bacterium]